MEHTGTDKSLVETSSLNQIFFGQISSLILRDDLGFFLSFCMPKLRNIIILTVYEN